MFRLVTLPALLVIGVTPALTQQPSSATSVTATYSNDQLGIHFTYPGTLIRRDPDAAMEAGHLQHFGAAGETDPEHVKAKKCMHIFILLSTEEGPEKKADTPPAVKKDAAASFSPDNATLFLAEFDQTCLTPQQKAQGENLLGGLA